MVDSSGEVTHTHKSAKMTATSEFPRRLNDLFGKYYSISQPEQQSWRSQTFRQRHLCVIVALLEDRKKKMTVGSVGFSDDIRHKIEE
jgi:hypothetical protein